MDILLNPNVAYLLLVAGTLLALLALITPGTGLLEIAAVFCLFLAGYAVYNTSFNWWALLVLLASFVPFVYAMRRPRREPLLLLTILGMVAGSVFLFTASGRPAVNPVLAAVVSILYSGFLWISVRKVMQAAQARPSHDLGALIGQAGEARTRIHEDGSVQVNGELWSARSSEEIPAGSAIKVVGREGFVLLVEKPQESR